MLSSYRAVLATCLLVATATCMLVIKTAEWQTPYRCPSGAEEICATMASSKLKPFGFRVVSFSVVVPKAPSSVAELEVVAQKVLLETVVPTVKATHRKDRTRKLAIDILTEDVDAKNVVWKPTSKMEPVSVYRLVQLDLASTFTSLPLGYEVDGEKHTLDPGDSIAKITLENSTGSRVTTYAIYSKHGTLKFEFYTAWQAQELLQPKINEAPHSGASSCRKDTSLAQYVHSDEKCKLMASTYSPRRRRVPSALEVLTAVFGMGTGVAPPV